jgi:hypothetical protein
VVLVLSACAQVPTAELTTTSVTTTSTTAPVTTTEPPADQPPTLEVESVTDASSPWLSVAVGDGEIQVSGQVSAGATVHFEVTDPTGAVSRTDAEVENAWFYGLAKLGPGPNTLTVVATGPDGATISVERMVRYEPDATVEFGFLTRVSSSEIDVDYAQWLSGEEAAQAAFEDGYIDSVEEGVPNDYYIRNVNPLVRTLPLNDEVAVWLVTSDAAVRSVPVGMDEWLGLFRDGFPWDYEVDDVPTGEPPHFSVRVWSSPRTGFCCSSTRLSSSSSNTPLES